MTPEFTALLTDFRNTAWAISKPFGQLVNDTIASEIPAGMGLVATDTETQVSVVDKLTNTIDSVAQAYLKSVGQYYTVKGQLVQLKAAAKGGVAVQAQQNINAAGAAFQKNPLPWIAGAGLLLVLLMRK